eukprot:TRINITY_DN13178_c0_g1_i1.p1 TRINITY_DN13178_c0_g1~~TRINITY_DN13178_c0_g1_i1.p1  ORF type:complete len:529 (+),score=91.93 TRINITY_DN13178_c0_g1_i1:40-1587(+)
MGSISLEATSSLAVNRNDLVKGLVAKTPMMNRHGFQDMCSSLATVLNHAYFRQAECLREIVHEEGVWEQVGDDRRAEKCTIKSLQALMKIIKAGRYEGLSESMFHYGVNAQNYSLGVHAELGMNLYYPDAVLKAALSSEPYWDPQSDQPIPLYCNRVLIFSKGFSTLKQKGLMILPKCNVIIEILLERFYSFCSVIGLWESEAKEVEQRVTTGNQKKSIHGAEEIKVINVRDCLTDSWWNLFKSIEITEVGFQKLIVVVPSEGIEADEPTKVTASSLLRSIVRQATELQEAVADAPQPVESHAELSPKLGMRVYTDYPLRNLGLLLPDKLVSTTNVDKLSFIMELFMIGFVLREGIDDLYAEQQLSWITISVIPMCIYRLVMLFMNWYWAVDFYKNVVKCYTGSKQAAVDSCAVNGVIGEVKDETMKTILVAYWILWQKGKMTEEALDSNAEKLVSEMFDVKIDFDVSDALQKLQLLGMVELSPHDKSYTAVISPDEFAKQATVPWTKLVKHLKL